jgi:hypothetical protein
VIDIKQKKIKKIFKKMIFRIFVEIYSIKMSLLIFDKNIKECEKITLYHDGKVIDTLKMAPKLEDETFIGYRIRFKGGNTDIYIDDLGGNDILSRAVIYFHHSIKPFKIKFDILIGMEEKEIKIDGYNNRIRIIIELDAPWKGTKIKNMVEFEIRNGNYFRYYPNCELINVGDRFKYPAKVNCNFLGIFRLQQFMKMLYHNLKDYKMYSPKCLGGVFIKIDLMNLVS